MGDIRLALNTIIINDRTMLLTQTGGVATHLTQPATDTDEAQPAIPSHSWPISRSSDIGDLETGTPGELSEPRWSSRTLCGIRWDLMAGSDPNDSAPQQHAPTCRRCLALVDRWFPTPVPDDRIGVLAAIIGQAVHDHGTAEVIGVPGDQLAALRSAARRELKQRFGYTAKTYVIDDLLVVASNDTTEQLRRETANEFLRAFGPADDQTPSIDDTGWRFHWRTWSTP